MEEAAAQAQVRRQVRVAGGQPDDEAEAAGKPSRVLPHRVGPNDDDAPTPLPLLHCPCRRFSGEVEYLYPPLTFLRPRARYQEDHYTIIEVVPQ